MADETENEQEPVAETEAAPEPAEEEAGSAEAGPAAAAAAVEDTSEADAASDDVAPPTEEPKPVAAPEPVAATAPTEQLAADPQAVVPVEASVAEPEVVVPVEASAAEPKVIAPAEEPSAAAVSGPKPKKKRLPRTLRPARSKPQRDRPADRRPIVRLEKPEGERGRRQERQGTVVSDAMDKTIVVKVDVIRAHPKYKKVVRRSVKFHAHDELNQAKNGDVVRIVETRPLSATKHWRLAEVVEAAK